MRHGMIRGLAIALIAVFATATFTASAPPASAWVSGTLWDPDFIISDQQFYDEDAMSVSQIQNFLNAKVPTCQPERSTGPNDPIVCLKDFKQTTISRAADAYCPNAYVGASNESAATIIYKVAQACGISPKVILVTLQKEVGLVTHTWPSEWRYDRAMGYGCPDTAPCDTEYYGFQNQVWRAARQFQVYRILPGRWGHLAGVANNVRFHPNTACGTSSVVIRNQATAGLYNYTPYQPNAAALAAMPGTGNACSSYGNRNFWMYYWEWFGDPTSSNGLPSSLVVDRIAGANRYETSVAISQTFGTGVPVAYVASGADYSDALAASPAAARQDGPLLLVSPDAVSGAVTAELQRLAPTEIVVVGGPVAVSDAVYDALAPLAGSGGIRRVAGENRYATANAIVRDEWSADSAPLVYLASGRGFPDALSAAAAAGSQGAPVITIDGKAATLDQATIDLIAYLGATEVAIAGGTSAVSSGIESTLSALPGVTKVSRLAGQDRYATSAAINLAAFSSSDTVYIASGDAFPDALSGAARAGIDEAALLIIPGSCVPRSIVDAINQLNATKVHILGGTSAISTDITHASVCP